MVSKVKINFYTPIVVLTILFFVLFIFTNWQPSGEVYAKWQSAAMLQKYGDFPVPSMPLLYTLYLQIFLLFDFPNSVHFEHIFTTLIATSFIFYFVKKYTGIVPAFIFCLAWFPVLWEFESGSRILGIAFLLHHMSSDSNLFSRGFFPLSLVLASLFESAYVIILVLYFLFYLYSILRSEFKFKFELWQKFQLIFILLMGCLVLFSTLNQSDKDYNNAYQFTYPFAPIDLVGSMNVSSLQIVTDQLSKKDTPKEDWYKNDWYFTYPKYFGDTENLASAVIKFPKIFINHALIQANRLRSTPSMLLFGPHIKSLFKEKYQRAILFLITYFIFLYLLYNNFKYSSKKDLFFYFFGGGVPILTALLMTHISFRYVFVLFPMVLYLIVNLKIKEHYLKKSHIFILISVLTALGTYGNLYSQVKNQNYNSENSFNYSEDGPALLNRVSKNTRLISTTDAAWIKSFSNADHGNIYELLYLPPFKEDNGETINFLRGLDEIWIDKGTRIKRSSIATQEYLRYELHLLPFEKKYTEYGFEKVDVLNYGSIYVKK